MSYSIKLPNLTGTSYDELRNYLFQFAEQVNYVFGQIESSQSQTSDAVKVVEHIIAPSEEKTHDSFNDIKQLIINSGDIKNAYHNSFFGIPMQISKDDVVIENGTFDSLSYRKWASGKMEAYGTVDLQTAMWDEFGSMYISDSTDISFPEFTDTPQIFVTAVSDGSTDGIVFPAVNSIDNGRCSISCVRPAVTSSDTFKCNIYLVGTAPTE